MTAHFEKHAVDAPRLSAELLLAHVIGCERLRLYMEADRPASPIERDALRALVERATAHEPIAYLLGEAWFFGLRMTVTADTLIPRPSTVTIVEHILQRQRAGAGASAPLIAEIGVGSGAVSIAIARHLRTARIIATDISDAAIEVARENAAEHKVADRMEFRTGSLLEPLRGGREWSRFDYIISNPPYISDAEWTVVDRNIRDYEPHSALRGGSDGLEFLRPLIQNAPTGLAPAGQVVFEFAASQRTAILALTREQSDLVEPHILSDHENLPRVLVATRRS
ncbi:MAG: peptide chain release factor N(5)-glutamine methyltransferase [Phycisphaerales bacterium]